jgi:dTDP-glucose 4,6-dehydratase
MHLLITGGAGFIGSHFTKRQMLSGSWDSVSVIDSLSYAGTLANLTEVSSLPNFNFIHGDICSPELVNKLCKGVDVIVNFAAESHVDRSLNSGLEFARTNVLGTTNLLEQSLRNGVKIFHQVSTDEVYGSIAEGSWDEQFKLSPNSPYSASKASSDLIALSYFTTHGLDVRISRCTNNFGPKQHTEKLIPKAITNVIRGKKIPIYGKGINIRDWLHVEDHCIAIEAIITQGRPGQIYNVGGGEELSNLKIAQLILKEFNLGEEAIEYVADRPGHDFRYSVNWNKLVLETGYAPTNTFAKGLKETIKWYVDNPSWWKSQVEFVTG